MRRISLLIIVCLSCFREIEAQSVNDPFYRYGFPQEQIYIDFEQALSDAKEVKKLKLEAFDLSAKLDKLEKFKSLKVLKLSNNLIDSLPEEIFDAGSLLYFESIGNAYRALPENFSNSVGLKELKIINAAIDSLPIQMSSVKYLRRIEFQSFEGDTLDLRPFLRAQRNLEELLLYKVPVHYFPLRDSSAKTLNQVYLVNCQLASIDSAFWNNRALEILVLDDNEITAIPDELLQLSSLKTLSLKNNRIKHLPELVSKLPNLELLNLSGNKIPFHELEIVRILMPNCKIIY